MANKNVREEFAAVSSGYAKLNSNKPQQKAKPVPNCSRCNGEREFDGNGGAICHFCGHTAQLAK